MEIELKLALDARHAARLRRHPLLAGVRPVRRALHSVYYDTPDFALMRRAIAFRLRRVGYHWVQTLKAEAPAVGALSSRPEWELPVAGSGPDLAVLPPEALALLRGIDPARLAPVFITEFRRTTWRLEGAGGAAELALDQGTIRAGTTEQPISELEIELLEGAPEGLFEWALELLEQVPLRVEPRSKAERGYVLCGAARPEPVRAESPDLRAGETASQAWAEIVRSALSQLVANVPGFLEQAEDIEYLHQLRIALRRLRGAAGLGDGAGKARPPWTAELAGVMECLNPARDWDVFVAETLPSLEAVLGDPHLGEAFLGRAEAAAARARRLAQNCVAAPEFTRLVLGIGRDLLVSRGESVPVKDWARRILERRWKKLHGQCRRLDELDPDGRHRLRIAAKKLRYAADALEGLYGKRARPFLKRLAALQDHLGRANDAVVAARLLAEPGWREAGTAYDAGRVAGALGARAGHRHAGDEAAWRRLVDAKRFW